MDKKTNIAPEQEPTYTKEQVLSATRYQARRDALSFLLIDGRMYTDTEIKTILDDYMKGEVK